MDVRRSRNISVIQKELLVQFMERNEDLRSGKFTENFTYRKAQILWKQLAEDLNCRNGAKKTWRQWRKSWHDLRSKLKSKQAQLLRQRLEPLGSDESQIENLSLIEERILAIVTNDFSGSLNSEINESEDNLKNETDNVCEEEMIPIKEEIDIDEHNVTENEPELIEIRMVQDIKQNKKVSNNLSHYEVKTKEDYYKQKLAILREDVKAKKRIAAALEIIAEKLN